MTAPTRELFELHTVGGFSLDAILHPGGRVETDRIGGNALWAAMGARAVDRPPRVHAVVGADYPQEAIERYRELGFDVTTIRRDPAAPGVRVSYSYRPDGSRAQPADPDAIADLPAEPRSRFVDTTQDPAAILASLPAAEELPRGPGAHGWHLGLLPISRFRELVAHLAGSAHLQADCAARSELCREGVEVLAETLPLLDVFLPSTSDTDAFLPGDSRRELLARFHALGARRIVLKCGEDGALVSEPGAAAWAVPAFPVPDPVDATGAGDVFAGAFAAGLRRGDDPVRAACLGAATASFAVMMTSPLALAGLDRDEVENRAWEIERRVVRDE